MTHRIKKLPSSRLHLNPSLIFQLILTWFHNLGTPAFSLQEIMFNIHPIQFSTAEHIIFAAASLFCLPLSWHSSVCMRMTLHFRSHACWPSNKHLPSNVRVALAYVCVCLCVCTVMLKLVLQKTSGWTQTIELDTLERKYTLEYIYTERNLISPDSEASGLFSKLWAAVWRSPGLRPRCVAKGGERQRWLVTDCKENVGQSSPWFIQSVPLVPSCSLAGHPSYFTSRTTVVQHVVSGVTSRAGHAWKTSPSPLNAEEEQRLYSKSFPNDQTPHPRSTT